MKQLRLSVFGAAIYVARWSDCGNSMLINHLLLSVGIYQYYEIVKASNFSAHLKSVGHENGDGDFVLSCAV